jgi:hypothetical protein
MEGQYVVASKDFHYDEGAVGKVKLGQVFQLQGHINDGSLLRHQLVISLDPQPDRKAFEKLPQCGECGRRFAEEWQRDRCGASHEMSVAEVERDNRLRVQRRVVQMGGVG